MLSQRHLSFQAEIKAGFFEIIDGRHRMEKALRENIQYIDSYKLKGEQLLGSFFTNITCDNPE